MVLKRSILFSIILLIPFCVHAQFGLGKKKTGRTSILNTPTIGNYVLHDPEYKFSTKLMDGYPDEKSAWIVYSDRDNNTTYQNPGNEKQPLASLNFMQACFVIGEKEDYVELAEYVPRVNISKGKKTLEDPKYLGWVNKNTLLLWNRALKDRGTNYYLKTITAFGTQRIFDVLPHHVSGDSIITFANPSLNQPAGKCGMENIFYIYKESVLGNEYLVGPDPNFLPENSTQSGIGWVSKDLVRIWGTKGFVALNPDMEASLSFYQSYPSIKNNLVEQDPIAIARSPYATPKSDLEKLYPILNYSATKEGNTIITTNFLEDALDKDKNRVYNISGDLISNEDIENFGAKSSKLNIVLVVSSGRKNGQYINNLQGVLETAAWQNAARNNFKEVNVGAVVYKDYGPNCDNAITPLTNDFRVVDEFLSDQRKAENDGCDDNNYYQGMYGGIIKAAKMLHDHSNESNIILVYGSGSDETARKGEAIKNIQSVKARLLFFQTHNIPNEPAYINFVGDAKELISKSAENITELKKKIIVPNTYPNILNGVSFVNDTTGRIQQLDYPNKAITQGLLLFPHDSENMPAKYLADYLDSLIVSVAKDNRTIDNALHSAIAQSGSGNTRIKKEFAYRFPKYTTEKIPSDFLKSNTLRDQNFLIPAWTVLRGNTGLTAGVLLSEKEYADFANQLALLGGSGNYNSRDVIVKQISDAVEKTQSAQNVKIDKPVKEITFSEALGFISGYFPLDPVWGRTTLAEYQSSTKVNGDIGKVFLEECKNKAVWLHDHNNNANLQIRNNGRIYYLIGEAYLPINTVIDNRPPEKNITAGAAPVPVPDKTKDKDRTEHIGSVISDYNTTTPAQTQTSAGTAAQKGMEDIGRAKPTLKKDNASGQEPPVPPKTGRKKESSDISSINDDLNSTPPAGTNTAAKENNTDTVNYRKRIATQQQPQEEKKKPAEKKKEQPKRTNADFEHDLKVSEHHNTIPSPAGAASEQQLAAPKVTIKKGRSDDADFLNEDLKELPPVSTENKKGKKQAERTHNDTINYRNRIAAQPEEKKETTKKPPSKRSNAELEQDLKELQGNAAPNHTTAAPGQLTAPNVSIKKEDREPINTVREELEKTPVKEEGKGKKEKTAVSNKTTDTLYDRNGLAKQKKEKEQKEKKKTKNYNELDNDLQQLQQQDNSKQATGQHKEKLTAPNVRIKTTENDGTPAAGTESVKSKEDFNGILNDLNNASSDKNNTPSAEKEETSDKKKKTSSKPSDN